VFLLVQLLFLLAVFSSVGLFFSTNVLIQGLLVSTIWIFLFIHFKKYKGLLLISLVVLSSFSFIFSSNYFENLAGEGIDSSFFYQVSAFSPIYLFARTCSTLWNSQWMYVDTPFHFYFESANTSLQAIFYFMLIIVSRIFKSA
jgi:hypothetical protein